MNVGHGEPGRPRLCYVCGGVADIADLVTVPESTMRRDGTVERGDRWAARFLCDAHIGVDPWAA